LPAISDGMSQTLLLLNRNVCRRLSGPLESQMLFTRIYDLRPHIYDFVMYQQQYGVNWAFCEHIY
jgi:hypothetical protein